MTADLHNTVRISNSSPFGELPLLPGLESGTKSQKSAENAMIANNTKLSASTFRLPNCHIR